MTRAFLLSVSVLALLVVGTSYDGVAARAAKAKHSGIIQATPAPTADVTWSDMPLEEAIERAQEQGRKVFIFFHATWCGPCKSLDKKVFSTAEGGELLADTIALRLDVDDDANKEHVSKHRIRVLPTSLVLDGSGKSIGKIKGFPGRARYLKRLRSMLGVKRDAPSEPSFHGTDRASNR